MTRTSDSAYISTREAAAELGVTPRRVVMLIHAKRLPAQKIAGVWLIRRRNLKKVAIRLPGQPGHQSRSS